MLPDSKEALAAYRAGDLTQEALARTIFADSRLRRIVRAVGAKYNLRPQDQEDVFQRSMIVLFDKYVDSASLSDVGGIYSLWYAISQRVSQEVVANSKERQLSCECDADNADPYSHNEEIATEIDDLDIESSLAADEFNRVLAKSPRQVAIVKTLEFSPVFHTSESLSIAAHPKQSGRVVRRLTTEQAELVAIRESLGMTIQEFAAALEIKPERLSSYLYGKTGSVPSFVMQQARELKHGDGHRSMQFANRPMATIASDWMDRLLCNEDQLAKLLGVSLSTVERWLKNGPRPELARLMEYDSAVTRTAAFTKTRAA